MPRLTQAVARVNRFILRKKRTIQVTLRVTPTHDTDNLKFVSDTVRDLLAETCIDPASDVFKDVELVNACEEWGR